MQSIPSKLSCFSDQPIKSQSDDLLKNNHYAKGLLEFIRIADAPITIGIQGGWGSGKTSLINLLQNELEIRGDSLCINVNAWQQSLFANSGKSGEIALSLLESAYGELKDQIQDKHNSGKIRITEDQKQSILRLGRTVVHLTAAFTGIPLPIGEGGIKHEQQRSSQTFKKLRADLNNAIDSLITDDSNSLERIVIFVDDLDRIQPEIAVEVLDVLKNVFDIEHCISVLAIDYDVVIKGLSKKFGAQEKNQREFRQYFDKIIQIPFSMPTGAYRHNIPALLENMLEKTLPIVIDTQNRKELIDDLTRVALLATDGVPRSIKRIINTASLLTIVESATSHEEDKVPAQMAISAELQFKILLTVVCLQVSFPDIHKALCKLPDLARWDDDTWSQHGDDDALDDLMGDFSEHDWGLALLRLILLNGLAAKATEIRDIFVELGDYTAEPGGQHALRKILRSTSITDTDNERSLAMLSNISKEDANKHCKHLLETLLGRVGDDKLGRVHRRKVAKEDDGLWTLEHTGLTSYPICVTGLEEVDIALETAEIPLSYSIEFFIPKAKRNMALRNEILAAGFYDRSKFEWFAINVPASPAGGVEPNIAEFDRQALPAILKLLDILG